MKQMRVIAAVAAIFLLAARAEGASWYVSLSGTSGGVGSPLDPFNTIQAGLDASSSGDNVVVFDGSYSGAGNVDLDFAGKAVTLESQNGLSALTIDCENTARGFIFDDNEPRAAVVDGFTIINGKTTTGENGAGILVLSGARPTVRNCSIINCNSGGSGGGIYAEGGYFFDLSVTGCAADDSAGGIYITEGLLSGVSVDNNQASVNGGGIYASFSQLVNCTVSNNNADAGGMFPLGGGGIIAYVSELVNCLVVNNTTANGNGGGINGTDLVITNCTIADNDAAIGGGVYSRDCLLQNAVIYYNTAGTSSPAVYDADGSTVVKYSTVQGGYAGEQNRSGIPGFADRGSGDYHLAPGAGAKDRALVEVAPGDDLDNEPRYLSPDQGAFEYVGGTDRYSVSGSVSPATAGVRMWIGNSSVTTDSSGNFLFEKLPNGSYTIIGSFTGYAVVAAGSSEFTINGADVTNRIFSLVALSGNVYISPVGDDVTGHGTAAEPFATLGLALKNVPDGGTIIIGPAPASAPYTGSWNRGLSPDGKSVTIRSSAGADDTVFDCENYNRFFSVTLGETGVVVDGLSVFNGSARAGGGGFLLSRDCSAVVRNCRLENCSAGSGGGVAVFEGNSIENLLIVNCSAAQYGGGAYLDTAAAVNCTVYGNTAGFGGGVYAEDATLINMILRGNTATSNDDQLRTAGATTVDYCCVEGGVAGGTGNMDADPLFADAAGGDFHLLSELSNISPCIDTGTASGAPIDDLDRNPRDVSPDMGAYEYQLFTVSGTISGPAAAATTISYDGDANGSSLTNLSGSYAFDVEPTSTVTVTPSQTGFVFGPESRDVSIQYADVSGIDFTSAQAWTLSGSVTGSIIEGVTLSITGSNTLGYFVDKTVVTGPAGGYSIPFADGTYTVTPVLAGYRFLPPSQVITVTGGDVTGVDFTSSKKKKKSSGMCSTAPGRVSGAFPVSVCFLFLILGGLAGDKVLRRKR